MKKQFLRVKQIADQTFLRAEKSDVLTEDLLIAEKRVDSIKASCQATQKKVAACQIDFGSETSVEKRLRKIPQVQLGASMLESGCSFSRNSILADTLRECASVQTKLGSELFDYCTDVEKSVLRPVSGVLDNEIHNINKLRKQLGKLVLDMDSARTRFQTAERHSQQSASSNNLNAVGKVDTLKEEMEEASQKVEQCRDALATEMFSLIGREPHLARLFLQLHQLQAAYHRNALSALESSLPTLENLINNFSQKPVYGCSLEEHLRVTEREIAQVVETTVSFLLEYGILEEGLLRVAGSAIKVKKLKSAFDAGIELDMEEYVRDPHAVAGAFKSYLRELPDPLLTSALYNDWMNAAKHTDFDSKLQALWQVLHRLPSVNLKNLKFVIKFLAKVQENMDVNKMSSQNIAIVMAPNLIWSPTDESATIGINMSTASLHTSIVDMLISYADWFFPEDSENGPPPPLNMNDDLFSKEVNGNNSPRSPQNKNFRKPAAPPPPAQRCSATPPLIDLLDGNDVQTTSRTPSDPENPLKRTIPSARISSDVDATFRTSSDPLCKENSDSVSSDLVSFRAPADKPVVPEKPNYSSCSLDRKSLRQNYRPARPDPMSRSSHVERPSVPPPERPDKAAKSSSQENLAIAETEKVSVEVVPEADPSGEPPRSRKMPDMGKVHEVQKHLQEVIRPVEVKDPSILQKKAHEVNKQLEIKDPVPPTVQRSSKVQEVLKSTQEVGNPVEDKGPSPATVERSSKAQDVSKQLEVKDPLPPTVPRLNKSQEVGKPVEVEGPSVQRSRSVSKMNRFDFLVNQREERPPPERPPRSMDSAQSSVEEPASPKMAEVERAKPPRPLPPAKPKLNLHTENTSL